ncbi:MAG TPA: hypothetical protein PKB10_12415, partial [Tepidisphaeraceae bacterium]|nr:hypothetical protein [Tepidisphaeraceae bacterium]
LDVATAEIAARQAALDEQKQQASSLGEQIRRISDQLGAAREQRSALVSRQRVLQDLEQRREGVSDAVKAVLRQKDQLFPFVRGLVADVLRVDVEHAQVIEAALDGRDQWLLTDAHESAASHREALGKLSGRVNFVSLGDSVTEASDVAPDWHEYPQPVRLAIDLVRVEPEHASGASRLLGRTAVVETLDDALALHRAGPAGWRYVTKSCEVVEADGVVRAGPLTASMSLLSRRSELESIAAHIVDIDERIAQISRQLTDTNAAAKSLEEQTNAMRNELY